MSFDVAKFSSQGLQYGGARPTQFEVMFSPPFGSAAAQKIRFTCRSASLPSMNIDKIPVPYFGRHINVSGDRDVSDWNVTILNDDDFSVRTMMEKWSNMINYMVSNTLDPSLYPTSYKVTANVIQYNKIGNPISAYNLYGLFPTSVDAIPLDWDQTNTIEQFDVTFACDYWEKDSSVQTTADDWTGNSPSAGVG